MTGPELFPNPFRDELAESLAKAVANEIDAKLCGEYLAKFEKDIAELYSPILEQAKTLSVRELHELVGELKYLHEVHGQVVARVERYLSERFDEAKRKESQRSEEATRNDPV